MSAINDGGAAFARAASKEPDSWRDPEFFSAQQGMTLRDYFAGQAISGVRPWDINAEEISAWAYKLADAMLKAREVTP